MTALPPGVRRSVSPLRTVDLHSILDADPDLGADLGPGQWEQARAVCRGRAVTLRAGACDLDGVLAAHPSAIGFLIVDGLLRRETSLRNRGLIELVGAGDVIQPATGHGSPILATDRSDAVIDEVRMLELGIDFIRCAGRWPGLLGAVLARVENQRRHLITQELIVHLPLAEHRVLFMLWHLAGRWGQVTVDGVRLRLRLTHAVLGQLIAAKRPTVSLAVRRLEEKGCVRRTAAGAWLITTRGQSVVNALARTEPPVPGTRVLRHGAGVLSAAAPAAPPRVGRARPRTLSGAPALGR